MNIEFQEGAAQGNQSEGHLELPVFWNCQFHTQSSEQEHLCIFHSCKLNELLQVWGFQEWLFTCSVHWAKGFPEHWWNLISGCVGHEWHFQKRLISILSWQAE